MVCFVTIYDAERVIITKVAIALKVNDFSNEMVENDVDISDEDNVGHQLWCW